MSKEFTHGLLPPLAMQILKDAAKVKPEAARRIAVDRAINKVKEQYPHYFKKETVNEDLS